MSTEKCNHHLWYTTGFGFTQKVRCVVCDAKYTADNTVPSSNVILRARKPPSTVIEETLSHISITNPFIYSTAVLLVLFIFNVK